MTRYRFGGTAVIASLMGLGAAWASAQESSGPVAKVQGSSVVKRLPTTMIVRVELAGEGADFDAALADLEAKEQAARLTLASLDADEKTIAAGPVAVPDAQTDPRARFRQMVESRLGNGPLGAGEAAEGTSEKVSVQRTLTARWPLTGADAAGLVVETANLKRKIEEADIAGTKNAGAESLEEEELMEEAEMMGYDPYTGEPKLPPGTPQFAYAALIAPEERAAAMRQAFTDARKRADELAAAAGMEVEGVASVEDLAAGASVDDPYGRYMQMQMQTAGVRELLPEAESDPSLASVTPGPTEARFDVSLGVVFRLRPIAGAGN